MWWVRTSNELNLSASWALCSILLIAEFLSLFLSMWNMALLVTINAWPGSHSPIFCNCDRMMSHMQMRHRGHKHQGHRNLNQWEMSKWFIEWTPNKGWELSQCLMKWRPMANLGNQRPMPEDSWHKAKMWVTLIWILIHHVYIVFGQQTIATVHSLVTNIQLSPNCFLKQYQMILILFSAAN